MSFKNGDIVWVRRDPLPIWPSRIISQKKGRKSTIYTVEFFKDPPNKDVEEKEIMGYEEYEEENRPSKEVLRKNKRLGEAMEAVHAAILAQNGNKKKRHKESSIKEEHDKGNRQSREAENGKKERREEEKNEKQGEKGVSSKGNNENQGGGNQRNERGEKKKSLEKKKGQEKQEGREKLCESRIDQKQKTIDKIKVKEKIYTESPLQRIQRLLQNIFFQGSSVYRNPEHLVTTKEKFANVLNELKLLNGLNPGDLFFSMVCGLLNYFVTNLDKTSFSEEIGEMKKWITHFNEKALEHLNTIKIYEEVVVTANSLHLQELDSLIDEGVPSIVIVRIKNDMDYYLRKKLLPLNIPPQQLRILKRRIESHLVSSSQNDVEGTWKMLKDQIEKLKSLESTEDVRKLLAKT